MKQKTIFQRIGDFMEGKGFYIVLFLCVSAIGISGYYLFTGLMPTATVSQQVQDANASAQVEVVPEIPAVKPAPAKPKTDSKAEAVPETNQSEPAPEANQKAVYTWPVNGKVNRDFSLEVFAYDATMGDWRTHSGLDIAADIGTEVMATSSGTVKSITQDALMGTTVTIDHGDGMVSVYSNLAELPTVEEGICVSTGTVIGSVGETAIAESSDPCHLHFEMHQDGKAVDPMQFLPQ